MALTNEHVGPMILAKIKIYVFTRAELLFQVCYETPCISLQIILIDPSLKYNHGISIIVWSLQTNMTIILLPF